MDARAKSKALFKSKLNARMQEKQKIDSPLVRYNEHDQLVCRVCDVIVKSESLWPAHQASRKHHEAVDNLKVKASAVSQTNNVKLESAKDLQKPRKLDNKNEPPVSLHQREPSSLPSDFFDGRGPKRPKAERDSTKLGAQVPTSKDSSKSREQDDPIQSEFQSFEDPIQVSKPVGGVGATKNAKDALPTGFFDNKDADLRARGIVPVKPDVKDEYKEFEKLIKDDLQEIDNRMEEEEFDAAETIEEEETVEQRSYKERVEMLRRKKLELRASKSSSTPEDHNNANVRKSIRLESSSSSDEEDDGENFKVDWRAKHL